MVFASMPVLSERRFAALPVGAARATFTPLATRIRRMALTKVVLPTPGPPVITMTFDETAFATASRWLGAKVTPSFCSIHGMALTVSMLGQDGLPTANAVKRLAMIFSAFHRWPRKIRFRPEVPDGGHREEFRSGFPIISQLREGALPPVSRNDPR